MLPPRPSASPPSGDLLVFKLKAALVSDETGADRQELFQHFQVIFTDRAADSTIS